MHRRIIVPHREGPKLPPFQLSVISRKRSPSRRQSQGGQGTPVNLGRRPNDGSSTLLPNGPHFASDSLEQAELKVARETIGVAAYRSSGSLEV